MQALLLRPAGVGLTPQQQPYTSLQGLPVAQPVLLSNAAAAVLRVCSTEQQQQQQQRRYWTLPTSGIGQLLDRVCSFVAGPQGPRRPRW
jgi:hypothetical protein